MNFDFSKDAIFSITKIKVMYKDVGEKNKLGIWKRKK